MANLTLEQMLRECATYTDTQEELIPAGGPYTGKALTLANKFITALNYAKGKIVRERYMPMHYEKVTLPADKILDFSALSKSFLKLIKIEDANENEIVDYKEVATLKIKLSNYNEGDSFSITYGYMPIDQVNLADVLDLPAGIVDGKIPCFYAAYQYFLIEGKKEFARANYYLSLWNDGLETISRNIGVINNRVRRVGD